MDKAGVVEIQGASALASTFDMRRLKFNADASGAAANGSEQGDVTEAGAKIDEGILVGERGSADEIEDVASGSGLISDHFWSQLDERRRGRLKLEDSGEQIVEIVVGTAICEIGRGVWIGHPLEESGGAGSALNVATDRIVESGINGFQLGVEDGGTVVKRR
jgi:hypothetical protein